MSVLSYIELVQLVEDEVISPVSYDDINAASIDIHLGDEIVVEVVPPGLIAPFAVDIHKREVFTSRKINIAAQGHYDLAPDEFILAHTREIFNLPLDICAEFKLKSSGARTGLENALATWADNGWHGSTLTLELKNFLQWHPLRLTPGMKIGQMVFHRTVPVPMKRGYGMRGRYNNDKSVQTVKE